MTEKALLLSLLDTAIAGIEDGRVEKLLEAQLAVYGLAQALQPVRGEADVVLLQLCEYCLDSISHGERDREWGAASVLGELRRSVMELQDQGKSGTRAPDLVNVSA